MSRFYGSLYMAQNWCDGANWSIGCGFHVQNPSNADLLCNQN